MNGVTTEWFDLQVKYGNYLPNEEKTTLIQEQMVMREEKAEDNKLENKLRFKEQDEVNELEDDLGTHQSYVDFEDDFTKQYMAKRMQDMKLKAIQQKYGQVWEISRDEYIREVTEADPESTVILHLYQPSN